MASCEDAPNPTSRTNVFHALDTERDYQLRRWGFRQPNGTMREAEHSVCDFITYMQHYMTKTLAAASEVAGNDAALEMMRKVVALGVACFEQHGIAPRDLTKPVINGRDGLQA